MTGTHRVAPCTAFLAAILVAGCGGDSSTADGGDLARVGDGGAMVDLPIARDLRSATDGAFDLAIGDGAALGTASVIEHHNSPRRTGLYIDATFTPAAAALAHRDLAFQVTLSGAVKAQPLFLDGGPNRKDLLLVVTETNFVYGIDTAGTIVWSVQLAPPVALANLPCGNIDPLGITGTPVLDEQSRTLYLDAMTSPDGGTTKTHLIYALAADSGAMVTGWPVDVNAKVNGFDSSLQNQRGALALVAGTLYVPYGGHYGDCGDYRGWVVALPLQNPQSPTAWATAVRGGGVWSVGGVISDGSSLFVSTGNTIGTNVWGGGEAVIRLGAGATFSNQAIDYFSPVDWMALDTGDTDIGSASPILVDVPGGTPSTVIFQQGKNKTAYLLDPANLGGIGGALSITNLTSSSETVGAPAAYTTAMATYVVALGPCANAVGNLIGLTLSGAAPPTATVAWCGDQHGQGSPIVTSTDGKQSFIVWAFGGATENGPGDNRLYAFDGDTGNVLFGGGGGNDATPTNIARFQTPIVAKGRIYVASTGRLSRYLLK